MSMRPEGQLWMQWQKARILVVRRRHNLIRNQWGHYVRITQHSTTEGAACDSLLKYIALQSAPFSLCASPKLPSQHHMELKRVSGKSVLLDLLSLTIHDV